ncbi:MAG: putative excinuclease subunit domain protein [Candidatus Saccharibacteria bacterium]|nr:putative excinuclease subunit domain protein [Candidatus Saccharibacteria bacterium]
MNEALQKKLLTLPKGPGVYFHKNAKGEIIYIGKAARLNMRVRQYFQKSRVRDPKTDALVLEIFDTTWIEVETELDALFLEAELIRRYLPPYNILLRDDKSLSFVRIDIKNDHPTVSLEHRPLDDGAQYFGPYYSAYSVRKALKFLRRIFPFDWKKPAKAAKRATLDYHIGLSPGLEQNKTSLEDYRANLRQLARYLKGERKSIMNEMERDMKKAAKNKEFEMAAVYRNKFRALESLHKQIVFSDREFMDMSKDAGLADLTELLGLDKIPRRIEGYDISHMGGTDTVASMVVFQSGLPDKAAYRKFKMRIPGNDDFAHMREVMERRLHEPNVKQWGMPNLYLIDGGKGQLSSALEILGAHEIKLPAIGLAKQFEEIVIKKDWPHVKLNEAKVRELNGVILESDDFWMVNLPNNSHIIKLLQRIRDESHRFAVSYHTVLKRARNVGSMLDDIPTIGPTTRKKLLREFGSYKGVQQARDFELVKVVGESKAAILKQYLRAYKKSI